jgi:hypothetical protein
MLFRDSGGPKYFVSMVEMDNFALKRCFFNGMRQKRGWGGAD